MYSRSERFWASRLAKFDSGRVVVADRDETVFAMVRQLTAPDIWQVAYAGTPEELLSILHKAQVSLAVVELLMLDDCPTLADDLVARSRRGLRVVVTTSEHSESSERRARLIGPVYYAPKPIDASLLNHVLEGALGVVV